MHCDSRTFWNPTVQTGQEGKVPGNSRDVTSFGHVPELHTHTAAKHWPFGVNHMTPLGECARQVLVVVFVLSRRHKFKQLFTKLRISSKVLLIIVIHPPNCTVLKPSSFWIGYRGHFGRKTLHFVVN